VGEKSYSDLREKGVAVAKNGGSTLNEKKKGATTRKGNLTDVGEATDTIEGFTSLKKGRGGRLCSRGRGTGHRVGEFFGDKPNRVRLSDGVFESHRRKKGRKVEPEPTRN